MQFAVVAVVVVLAVATNSCVAHPAPAYGAPAPSYGAPAPSYGAPVYQAPVYQAPVIPGPAVSYTYPSPAPVVPCGRNLLVSCSHNVSPVGCQSYSPPQYAAPSYGAPAY